MKKRLTLVLGILAAAFAIGACGGGDEPSREEYAADLDAACETFQTNLEEVPGVAQEEGLSIEESRSLGLEYADEFEAEVEGLEPPSDLEESADALQQAIGDPPSSEEADPGEFLTYYEELRALYEQLGASGCVQIQSDAIETLEEIQKGGLFENSAPAG